jgi:hypothetical protein
MQREVARAVVQRLRVWQVHAEQCADVDVVTLPLNRLAGDEPIQVVDGESGVGQR